MHWYVMQPFYRRWTDINDTLDSMGVAYLHPYQFKVVTTSVAGDDASNIYDLAVRPVPILQMIFFYAEESDLKDIRTRCYSLGRVLTDQTVDVWRPMTIPDRQVLDFFKALSLNAKYDIVEDRPDIFTKGEVVKVIGGGKYEGLEGVICRIKHDKHLIVRINGVCAISTDYVPQAFLIKKSDPNYNKVGCTPPHMRIAELAYYIRTLTALCRETSASRTQIEATLQIVNETKRLITKSQSLAARVDLSEKQLDNIVSTLAARVPTASDDDKSMPIDCHTALQLCAELSTHYK